MRERGKKRRERGYAALHNVQTLSSIGPVPCGSCPLAASTVAASPRPCHVPPAPSVPTEQGEREGEGKREREGGRGREGRKEREGGKGRRRRKGTLLPD